MFSALTLKMLVRHISVEHAAMPNFKVICGVDGCPDQYKKMNSFRKHLRLSHADEYCDENLPEDEELPRNEDPPLESSSASESDCDGGDHSDSVDDGRLDGAFYNPINPVGTRLSV